MGRQNSLCHEAEDQDQVRGDTETVGKVLGCWKRVNAVKENKIRRGRNKKTEDIRSRT